MQPHWRGPTCIACRCTAARRRHRRAPRPMAGEQRLAPCRRRRQLSTPLVQRPAPHPVEATRVAACRAGGVTRVLMPCWRVGGMKRKEGVGKPVIHRVAHGESARCACLHSVRWEMHPPARETVKMTPDQLSSMENSEAPPAHAPSRSPPCASVRRTVSDRGRRCRCATSTATVASTARCAESGPS